MQVLRGTGRLLGAAALAALMSAAAIAQTPAAAPPKSLSAEAQAWLAKAKDAPQPPADIAARRAFLDKFQQDEGARQQKTYHSVVKSDTLAGVPVRLVTPADGAKTNAVLLNLHGGGFNGDSGSLTETIPVAALTGIPVVAVLYRLAPEHIAPAAVDDALAVYRELLKTHKPSEIGVFGTSAGAVLGPQLMMRLKAEGLPIPAVLGVFSGDADLSQSGASAISHNLDFVSATRAYLGKIANADPSASPLLGDMRHFPPTLCVSSTDDFFLSSTSNFCRGLDRAGVENKLVVFDALPHAFWAYVNAPESDEAFQTMSRFLMAHLVPG